MTDEQRPTPATYAIQPATDEEIASWHCGGRNGGCEDWPACEYCRMVARIEADAETIASERARADKAEADAADKRSQLLLIAGDLNRSEAEVERLRHALKRLSCHPCRYQGPGGWKKCHGKPDEMCDMCCARAALTASEPGSRKE